MALDISLLLETLATTGGYAGVLIANLIGSATIIFPVPAFLVTLAFANTLNPWLLALAAGFGSAVGELTAYALGRGGREVIKAKYMKWLEKAEQWIARHGPFPIIILFAAAPLPTDIVGILSGVISYDVRKFFLAIFIGKIIKSLILIFSFIYGLGLIYNIGAIS